VKIVRIDATHPITRLDSRGASIGGVARSSGEVRPGSSRSSGAA